jgi:hypothetical protein
MSQETTVQLPIGPPGREYHGEFMIRANEDGSVCDVYTSRDNYEDLPPELQTLTWRQERNPLFIHVTKMGLAQAWRYLKNHAILDVELEKLNK